MPPVTECLTGNYLYFNFLHYLLSKGYVQEMKELLFAMTKEKDLSQLKAVYEKYSANVPESLSSQLPENRDTRRQIAATCHWDKLVQCDMVNNCKNFVAATKLCRMDLSHKIKLV